MNDGNALTRLTSISYFSYLQMKRATPYNFSVGSACANNTGYCDFFQYCQRVDLEGPLLQLFNLYFTSEGKWVARSRLEKKNRYA